MFRKGDIEIAFSLDALPLELDQTVFLCVDPGAGGPQSDYAVVSIARIRGTIQVRALREHPRFLARVDELLHALLLVGEEVVREARVEVVEEARELGVVARDLHVDDLLLEVVVDVEQQEEDGEARGVAAAGGVLERAVERDGGAVAEVLDPERVEALADEREHAVAVLRQPEHADDVRDRVLRGRLLGPEDARADGFGPVRHCAGARHRRARRRRERCGACGVFCLPACWLACEKPATDEHCTEVSKQFAVFERHIGRIRAVPELAHSEIVVFVERNLVSLVCNCSFIRYLILQMCDFRAMKVHITKRDLTACLVCASGSITRPRVMAY